MIALTPAERLLLSLGIASPKEIDLEAIAWHLGAVVKYRPLDGCEALIVGLQKRAVISVNSRSLRVRQRFSIGHEIGHWHFHRGQILLCSSKDVENPGSPLNPERQADDFASDLILPGYMLRPVLQKERRVTLSFARDVGNAFDASVTATLLKIVKSNQFPLVVACYSAAGRRWWARADMVPGWWFPKRDLDDQTFAHELLSGRSSEDRFPRKIGADAWFDFRQCDRFEVQEQSMSLPNGEVLSVLTIPQTE
ncbi:ImmA/IrrE family metallo-endopeptidase [Reyranella sp.]|uniref:ImmA/IrrE family metallo-endopeptidase n=1 Tax=Reyranella sp. TaxID=1929291 RepID=UPI00272FFB04|nr:ImmA/IrrE family metallo-endopeptidase [Reyranella sp.]MDP2374404.1 ImmA/IrrE family metallo-endopeptidase [Reyranella sp.]